MSKYLQAAHWPFYPAQVKRGHSKLDPFLDYLTGRWQAGCHKATHLWRDLCAHGFDGSRGLVVRWAAAQRQQPPAPTPTASTQVPPVRSPRIIPWRPARTAWLLCKPEVEEAEQQRLERIKQADPAVAQAYCLAHTFQQMLRNHQPGDQIAWIQEVSASGIAALVSFANGIRQDLAAVVNALSSPWSNGQTEGQAGAPRARLKFLKRQMYGRANFDLLRRRVLGYPGTS